MEELKRCPFCGGKVAIAETGTDTKKWMFISRAHGENKCTCRVFMESGEYWFDCPEKDKVCWRLQKCAQMVYGKVIE